LIVIDRVYITIKGEEVTGQVSIPLGETGFPGTAGRYLNGKATLTAVITDGELIVHAKEFEVNGKSLPDNVKAGLANQNLAKDFANNPENREMINKIESFRIKDDKVYIKAKAKAKDEGEVKKESTEPKSKAEEKEKAEEKPNEPAKAHEKEKPTEEKPAEKKAA
jgi:hypothetical protein